MGHRIRLLICCLVAVACALPVVWLATAAFRSRPAITATTPQILFSPTLANLVELAAEHDLTRLLANSFAVASGTTLLTILLALPSAFYLAGSRSRFARNLMFFLLSTKMAPLIAITLPVFILFTSLGLRGTLTGLIIAQSVAALPLAIWLLAAFLGELPFELFWAAQLDGLTPSMSLWRALVPAAAPGVAAAGAFTFIFSWNEYLLASVLTTATTRPLTAELPVLITQGVTQWGQLAAGTLLSLAPVLALAILIRKYFIDGITAGALKKL